MKRIGKTSRARASRARAPSRSPKLPDELHPIVDAVVEMVFERLRSEAASAPKGPPLKRKTAKLALPLPKQRTALAEGIADLLLADLASKAPRAKAGRAPTPRAPAKKSAKRAARSR